MGKKRASDRKRPPAAGSFSGDITVPTPAAEEKFPGETWDDGLGPMLLVTVRLPGSAESFRDLEKVARAFAVVDEETRNMADLAAYRDPLGAPRSTTILSFAADTRPSVHGIVDPAWLPTFLGIVREPRSGETARDLSVAIARLTRIVRGLDERSFAFLATRTRRAALRLAEAAREKDGKRLRRLRKARRAFLGSGDGDLHVEIHGAERRDA